MAPRTRIRFKDLVFDQSNGDMSDFLMCRDSSIDMVVFNNTEFRKGYSVIVGSTIRHGDVVHHYEGLSPLEVEALMAHYEVTQEGKEE